MECSRNNFQFVYKMQLNCIERPISLLIFTYMDRKIAPQNVDWSPVYPGSMHTFKGFHWIRCAEDLTSRFDFEDHALATNHGQSNSRASKCDVRSSGYTKCCKLHFTTRGPWRAHSGEESIYSRHISNTCRSKKVGSHRCRHRTSVVLINMLAYIYLSLVLITAKANGVCPQLSSMSKSSSLCLITKWDQENLNNWPNIGQFHESTMTTCFPNKKFIIIIPPPQHSNIHTRLFMM